MQYNTTTLADEPNVTGHFGMMCNADITTMTSSKCTFNILTPRVRGGKISVHKIRGGGKNVARGEAKT